MALDVPLCCAVVLVSEDRYADIRDYGRATCRQQYGKHSTQPP